MAKETSSGSSGSAPSWGLVAIRLYVGWVWLSAGWAKVLSEPGARLVLDTRGRISESPHWYRWWGEDVVLAYPALFAFLIQWGELLCGVLLFLGALTRPVCAVVAFMLLNYYYAAPERYQSFELLLIVCAAGLFISRAGRRLGVDGLLAGRLPFWLDW